MTQTDVEDNLGGDFEYTACQQWEYRQLIFFPEGQEKTWLSVGQSFYRASKHLVEGVVKGPLREDIEGQAALFLFRHYLEVTLKEIVVARRYLTTGGGLAKAEVGQIKKTHKLGELWSDVLRDAKPKMPKDAPWEGYDWRFAERCILEFDAADKRGFAFRYDKEGGEGAHVDFDRLCVAMGHVHQVLDAILTVLIETQGGILDWLDELRSQAGW